MTGGELVAVKVAATTGRHRDGERGKSKTDWSLVDAVVLAGGPRAGVWFTVEDWTQLIESCVAMGRTADDMCGWPLGYGRSGQRLPHPKLPALMGRVLQWQGRPDVRQVADLADPRTATARVGDQ
jgi:hypothetical protein